MINDTVNIKYLFHAPIPEVWNAWTDPAIIVKWFGSNPKGRGLYAHMNLKPGGKYEISFQEPEGAIHTCYGVYQNITEFQKLSFTWNWVSEPGTESFVTILLFPEGGKTLMQFAHAHVGNKSMHNYLSGWTTTFDKLEALLDS